MKKWGFVFAGVILFACAFAEAKPRFPFPKTPDEVGQNDRDLSDDFETLNSSVSRISTISTTTLTASPFMVCIDSPTFCVDVVRNRVAIGTGTPSYLLHIVDTANADASIRAEIDNLGTGYSILRALNIPTGNYGDIQVVGSGGTGSQAGVPLARSVRYEGSGNNVFFTAAGGQLHVNTQTSNPILVESNNVIIASFTPTGDIFMKGAVLGISISTITSLAQKTSTSGSYAETGLSMPYTVKSATSTILVFASESFGVSGTAGTICTGRLRRGGTDITPLSDQHIAINDSTTEFDVSIPLIAIDAPAATGTVQYGVRFARSGGTGTCIANTTLGAVGGNGGTMMIVEVEMGKP